MQEKIPYIERSIDLKQSKISNGYTGMCRVMKFGFIETRQSFSRFVRSCNPAGIRFPCATHVSG